MESIAIYFIQLTGQSYRELFVLVFLLFLVVVDLEVAELIRVLGSSYNTQPISEVVLLQVLLCQILQVTLAEWHSGSEDNLVLVAAESDVFTEVTGLSSDLQSQNIRNSFIF